MSFSAYTNRKTDFTEKFFVRVDVTDVFPFLVTKMSPYYDREVYHDTRIYGTILSVPHAEALSRFSALRKSAIEWIRRSRADV